MLAMGHFGWVKAPFRIPSVGSRPRGVDGVVLCVGLMVLAGILLVPASFKGTPFLEGIQDASATLRGACRFSDLAQDIVGCRAIAEDRPAYLPLIRGCRELGIDWPLWHASTHPPTAFLLVAPVAPLSWPRASMIWGWFMVGLLFGALWLLGVPWMRALGLTPVVLMWPPVAASLGQLTLVWLFGIALGYACLKRYPLGCGIGVGLAALTKFLPGILAILFLAPARRRAWAGLALVWGLALAVLLVKSPACLAEYLRVNPANAAAMMRRGDNSGLLLTAWRATGIWGGLSIGALLLMLLWCHRGDFRQDQWPKVERLWVMLSYLAVALLPIAWVYSRAPLTVVFLYLARAGTPLGLGLGGLAGVVPLFTPAWGSGSVLPLVSVDILAGLALLVSHPTVARNGD